MPSENYFYFQQTKSKQLVEYLKNLTFDEKDFGIKYMFYDKTNGKPTVTLDAEFPEALREAVVL